MATPLPRFLAALLIVAAFGNFSPAQNSASPFQYCQKDQTAFCSDKTNPSEAVECLVGHDKEISNDCKEEIERFMQSRKQAAARGGGALSSFGGLNSFGPPLPLASYEGRYSPGTYSTFFTENKANISSPIYRSGSDVYSLSLSGSDLQLGSPLTLNSGTQVPAELYRVELGTQFFYQLPEKRNWGLRASIGYAGDAPFQNSSDVIYSLAATYGFPASGNNYWFLALFFSNNSTIGNFIPIPGFGYVYRGEHLNGIFGFPISSLQWTPSYPWSFSISVYGPTVQSEAAYGSIEKFQFFLGYYWTLQSYLPVQRTNSLFRLSVQEMKAGIGARTLIFSNLLGELQAGRAFQRSLYLGTGVFDESGGYLMISDDWYATWSLKAKF